MSHILAIASMYTSMHEGYDDLEQYFQLQV